ERSRDRELAFPPNRLPAHSGPPRKAQVGHEFCQVALVFGFARKSAPRVYLAGAAGTPYTMLGTHIAARHLDALGPLSHSPKIDFEWSWSVKRAQRTQPVANAREQH